MSHLIYPSEWMNARQIYEELRITREHLDELAQAGMINRIKEGNDLLYNRKQVAKRRASSSKVWNSASTIII